VAKQRNKFVDYLQYLGLRLFVMAVQMFEVEANYRTARWIGELLWRIDRRHRQIAIRHVRLSFPDWPEAKVLRVARKSMHNLLFLGLETVLTPRMITPNRWRRHVRLVNLAEAVRLLLRRKSGLIMLTGHFGNFEIVGYTMATLGFGPDTVARPLDNPYVWDYLVGILEHTGQRILYKKGAMAAIPSLLTACEPVTFVADQDAGRKGVFVDFFGRPASTYKSIGLLAIRHETPIVIGYGKRLSDRFEFEIAIQRIIYPHEWRDRDDELTWVTQEFTAELERIVRKAPEQYLWVHRRWKHRPDGTVAPKGIA
jgi:KDO2-lipid IV(A) lauroyltransferase